MVEGILLFMGLIVLFVISQFYLWFKLIEGSFKLLNWLLGLMTKEDPLPKPGIPLWYLHEVRDRERYLADISAYDYMPDGDIAEIYN